MSEELVLSMLPAVAVLVCAAAAVAIARVRKRREAVRARIVAALIGRFGDLPEFVRFAGSAEGRALIGAADAGAAIAARLLWSWLLASAMLGLGLVLLWLGHPAPPGADLNLVRAAEDYRWWGMVLTPVAVALLVAAGIAAALSRRWGMLGRDA